MRKVRYLFLLALILPIAVNGQTYTSRLGYFTVLEKKGCATFNVVLDTGNPFATPPVPPCTLFDPCFMEWGDGASSPNSFSHMYSQPGTYLLKVLFKQPFGYDDIEITVTPNIQPAFEMYTCSGKKVQVKVTDTNYDSYYINFGDGSSEAQVPKGSLATAPHDYSATVPPLPATQFISVRGKNVNADDNCSPTTKPFDVVPALVKPVVDLLTVKSSDTIDFEFDNASYFDNVIYKLEIAQNTNAAGSFQLTSAAFLNTSTGSLTGLRADDNYYCFRLGAFDPCVNSLTRSDIICTANFDAVAENNVNTLSWVTSTTDANFLDFSITRNGGLLPPNTNALTLSDDDVTCNLEYTYQLLTNYSNGSQSVSLTKTVTAFSSDIPFAIEDVTSVVGSDAVQLSWLQDPVFVAAEYHTYRKAGEGSYSQLGITADQQFSDAEYSTDGAYCYQINYTDACGNASAEGIEACPIRLSGVVKSDNTIDLTWRDYTGWKNGVDYYTIEKYDNQGNLMQTINNVSGTSFTDNTIDPDNQVYTFIVRAVANDAGLEQSVSNEITLLKEPNIHYPAAFTPNGDNLNDSWVVFGQYVNNFEMKIFNRWGELLFTTTSLDQGWDGNYKGSKQPEGTYTFVAKIVDKTGRTFDRSGSFVLLNKK